MKLYWCQKFCGICRISNGFKFFFQMEKTFFHILCTSKFFPIHWRVGKLRFLKSPWIHILLNSKESLTSTACLCERGEHNLWWSCQFSRKINVHIYITILYQFKSRKKWQIFPGVAPPPRSHPTVFGTSLACLPMHHFTRILSNMKK